MPTFLKAISKQMLFQTSIFAAAGSALVGLSLPEIVVASPAAGCDIQQADDLDSMLGQWNQELSAFKATVDELRTLPRDQRERGEALVKKYVAHQAKLETLRLKVTPVLAKAMEGQAALANDKMTEVVDLAEFALRADAYADTYSLLRPLLAQKSKNGKVYQMAAQATFGLDRFKECKTLIEKAKEFPLPVNRQLQQLSGSIDLQIKQMAAERLIREKETKAGDLPRVTLETTAGPITIELFENQAPNSVANFVNLVEKGFYNGIGFHRVLPGFMAQGGCPDGTGGGGPGYNIKCECIREDYRRHFSGTLSMAHAGKDTGGSQFFLTFLATPHLNAKHTAFGRVVHGMDVLAKIQKVTPGRILPGQKPTKILKATVANKRDHAYKPTTHPSRR